MSVSVSYSKSSKRLKPSWLSLRSLSASQTNRQGGRLLAMAGTAPYRSTQHAQTAAMVPAAMTTELLPRQSMQPTHQQTGRAGAGLPHARRCAWPCWSRPGRCRAWWCRSEGRGTGGAGGSSYGGRCCGKQHMAFLRSSPHSGFAATSQWVDGAPRLHGPRTIPTALAQAAATKRAGGSTVHARLHHAHARHCLRGFMAAPPACRYRPAPLRARRQSPCAGRTAGGRGRR